MKKLMVLAFLGLILACNNSAETEKTKDSTNVDANTHTSTESKGDTSSYDRMPNKMTDSTQQ